MRLVAALLALVCGAAGARAGGLDAAPTLTLDPPARLDAGASGMAYVSGRALGDESASAGVDLVLAIDSSDSSDEPAFPSEGAAPPPEPSFLERIGAWLGIGRRTESARAPQTILAAELAAARRVLAELDPATSRVALVLLAGDPPRGLPAAPTLVALTHEHERVRAALELVERAGPRGRSAWLQGVSRALAQLVGDVDESSSGAWERRRALLVLSDGRVEPGSVGGAVAQAELEQLARLARRARVRIDVAVFGEEASRQAPLPQALARATDGLARGVATRVAADAWVADLEYAGLAGIEVVNTTLGEAARVLHRRADGSFGSIVPLAPGSNRIEVVARAWNGRERRAALTLAAAAGDAPEAALALPPAALALRGQLLRALAADAHARGAERARGALELRAESPASPPPGD